MLSRAETNGESAGPSQSAGRPQIAGRLLCYILSVFACQRKGCTFSQLCGVCVCEANAMSAVSVRCGIAQQHCSSRVLQLVRVCGVCVCRRDRSAA